MTGKGWRAFKLVSMLLVLAALVCAFSLSMYNDFLFWIMLAIISALVIVYLILFSKSRDNLFRFVSEMEEQFNLTEKDSLYKFPAPALIIDSSGVIIWFNLAFSERIKGGEIYGTNLKSIVDVDLTKLTENKEVTVEFESGDFRVRALTTDKEYEGGSSELTLLCFEDMTELIRTRKQFLDDRTRVMIVLIDNLDEMISNSKDSDKGHITMQIDRLIEEFVDEHSGIIRKMSTDRYFCLISDAELAKLISDGFKSIMEKAHRIMVGEHTPVTLSIGVGKGSGTLKECEVLAKQALEMTQGRGGDQVAIKDDKEFTFFGGNSQTQGKNTKVKVRIFASGLLSLLSGAEHAVIMGHSWGDLDAVGSAAGLAGALRLAGVNAYVYSNISATLAMPIIDRLKNNLDEGEDLFVDEETAVSMVKDTGVLIVVDTNNKELLDSKAVYEAAHRVVYIDHHRQVVTCIDNAVLSLHEPYASSAAEMVTEVIQYLDIPGSISSYYADALLSGIMLDTKNFIVKTGVRTFEAAAYLKKLGADTIAVKLLFASSIETELMRSKFITTTEIYDRCAVAVSNENTPEVRVAAAQAADEMLGIIGVDASFVVFATPAGSNISARSFGALNVQLVMEKLGGGGHQTMAAAQLEVPPDEAKVKLIEAIGETMKALE
ncbi:MAG: DHH family phosphoesterase [Oscillospiraceae bacterium]|nr:DHH family phosphoesterase [Oscillospiraceae bacterium]